ncbi:molybdopterin molybdotransferase MoeA [Maridesulfovibrio sp. FT414]|uniref:molybdopterin molybdotransferase MoeA n=1 Tax=Maridesulfovibrio sp. FT414 TaxID=2979469 RepID=UPI003D80298B
MPTDKGHNFFLLDIPRAEALHILKENISPVQPRSVSVTDCCGCIAAETITSAISLPENDRSAMDGFAVSSADTAGATKESPVRMAFCGEVRPSETQKCCAPGECAVRVLTGGIVPEGTDAVIPFEKVTIEDDTIGIKGPVREGDFVRKAGSDIIKGETIVPADKRISPCEAALLAYTGIRSVNVRRPLSIGVLAVGNELCDPALENACGLIPADNLILMKSLCGRVGVNNVDIATCANSPESISKAICGNSGCDLIITTGGTGPGNRDFVFNSVLDAGGKPLFKGLAMHPAKSVFAFRMDSCIVIGLPGPPNAVNLAFHTIIRPVINILLNVPEISPVKTALLKSSVKGAGGREKMRPCFIGEENGYIFADPLTSGHLSPRKIMSLSNGIIILPSDSGELEEGQPVEVICYG